MPCDQITLQIDRSLDFLSTPLRNVPEQHRSLRAVFDRSWSLLTDVERTLLAQLSVFRGGFDLGAAEQVAGASLSLLAGLIDKSLVRPTRTGRHDLHELVRQYLLERLAESSDASGAARRHFDFYARLAADAEDHLYGPDQEVWFDRLEIEHDNLASALDWSLSEGHAEDGLRLASALGFFWDLRTQFHEGYAWFRKLLDNDRRAPAAVRIKALSSAGVFASYVGRRMEAAELCEEALARARDAGDQLNIAWSLTNLILTQPIRTSDDLSQAVAWLEEALGLFRAMDDGWGTSHALRRLGWTLTVAGELERAAALLEEALTRARSAQDNSATAWSLFLLGKVVWLLKRDEQRAVGLHEQSLCLARQTRNIQLTQQVLFTLGQIAYTQKNYIEARSRYDQVVALVQEQGGAAYAGFLLRPIVLGLAQLAVAGGEPEHAARLLGAAHEVLASNHHIFADRIDLEQDITTVRDQLGEARFAAEFADGRELSIAEAVSYAREDGVQQRNSR
jgi:predicted ATPase